MGTSYFHARNSSNYNKSVRFFALFHPASWQISKVGTVSIGRTVPKSLSPFEGGLQGVALPPPAPPYKGGEELEKTRHYVRLCKDLKLIHLHCYEVISNHFQCYVLGCLRDLGISKKEDKGDDQKPQKDLHIERGMFSKKCKHGWKS